MRELIRLTVLEVEQIPSKRNNCNHHCSLSARFAFYTGHFHVNTLLFATRSSLSLHVSPLLGRGVDGVYVLSAEAVEPAR